MKPSYEELESQLAASIAAERAWETAMMAACGEDGPKSVADKFAELKAQYAALASENAGLKQFPDQIVGFIGKLGSSEIGSETKEKIEAAAKKIKTPATDTFLAEVRASGVEAFASVLEARGKHHGYVEIANAYAALLRKGVQS